MKATRTKASNLTVRLSTKGQLVVPKDHLVFDRDFAKLAGAESAADLPVVEWLGSRGHATSR